MWVPVQLIFVSEHACCCSYAVAAGWERVVAKLSLLVQYACHSIYICICIDRERDCHDAEDAEG